MLLISERRDYAKIEEIEHNESIGMHIHKGVFGSFSYELVYVLSGRAIHRIGKREAVISGGEYFFIGASCPHGYLIEPGERLRLINFTFDFRALELPYLTAEPLSALAESYGFEAEHGSVSGIDGHIFKDTEDGMIRELFLRTGRELKERRIGYHQIVKGNLSEILISGFRIFFGERQDAKYTNAVRQIISRVDEEYMLSLSLSRLAEELSMTVPALSVSFKRQLGIGFVEYLHKKRVEAACNLLAVSKDQIEIIAERVGYSDAKKFRDRFKEIMGLTPRQYRKLFTVT